MGILHSAGILHLNLVIPKLYKVIKLFFFVNRSKHDQLLVLYKQCFQQIYNLLQLSK